MIFFNRATDLAFILFPGVAGRIVKKKVRAPNFLLGAPGNYVLGAPRSPTFQS